MNPAGETGASFSLYSHNGIMKFGVTTDVARVADPQLLVRLFEETLSEMLLMDSNKEPVELK